MCAHAHHVFSSRAPATGSIAILKICENILINFRATLTSGQSFSRARLMSGVRVSRVSRVGRTRLLELHILLGRTCGREALSGSNLHRGHPSDTQNTASRTISVRHTINVSFPFVCGALSLRPFFSNVIPTGPGRPFLEPNDCRLWKRKHVFDEISSSFRLK